MHSAISSKRCSTWPTLAAMLAAICLLVPALSRSASAKDRQLGTVGPPPRQKPQRQTAGEGMPPLPLPATPLRRSEPKAEPSAPVFIGRLAYGRDQDYMPNPGDLDNLLRKVRTQLGAWYGRTVIKAGELAAMHEKGKTPKIPMLYMTGYDAFKFSGKQRQALRAYLLDGGTLVADATLGSPAFTKSFRQELAHIFPQRKLEPLQLDHPVYHGYYKYRNVRYFTVSDGAHSRSESPPQMLGLNLAARTAVIFSPYDMTCGWDEFYAPPAPRKGNAKPGVTRAMMPADALRMGINIVAYVSAERNFGRKQAVTHEIAGNQPRQRQAVSVGLLRHNGDWNPDPNAVNQLLRLAAQNTSIPVGYHVKPVDAKPADLLGTPVVLMEGMDDPQLTVGQVQALRRHVRAGGFLFINNTSGYARFDREARALIDQMFPNKKLKDLPADHPLMTALYDAKKVHHARTGNTLKPRLKAITINDRAAVVYSSVDTLAMLKGVHDPYANAYTADSARKIALNILCYALQH